jgi:GNAT superfamily N-acetyltransferase
VTRLSEVQIHKLIEIVLKNPILSEILNRAHQLNIDQYYIGAGCVNQTVWNYLSDLPLQHGISDYDFVYFDDKNLGVEQENQVIQQVRELYFDLDAKLDVKNQARVHLWYEQRFGFAIEPYRSLEEAINTWPTSATAIGIRRVENSWKVYAPFGTKDIFAKIICPNKVLITKEIYENKVKRWISFWPDLTIIPWENQIEQGRLRHLNENEEFTINTDKNLLQMEIIQGFLSRSYWANTRTKEKIEQSIENSLCFGVYEGNRQVGFARVVTDYATMYWLCDVFIDEEYRGKGLGKKLVSHITEFEPIKNLTATLATKDAHELYEQYGYTKEPDRFMRRIPK